MTNCKVLIRHDCPLMLRRLGGRLPSEHASITTRVLEEGDNVLSIIQEDLPHALVLGVHHRDLDPISPTIASVRRRYRRGRFGIVAIVSNAPEGAALLNFGSGADELIHERDLDLDVLAGLLQAMTERLEGSVGDSLEAHGVRLVAASREVHIGDWSMRLPPSQFDMLWILVNESHRVVALEEYVDGAGAMTAEEVRRTGQMTAHRLRKSLGPHAGLVETVTGAGYRLRVAAPSP